MRRGRSFPSAALVAPVLVASAFLLPATLAGCADDAAEERSQVPGEDVRGGAGHPDVDLRADPGLRELARSVGGDSLAWTSMPGIPGGVLAGERVTVWFVRDLESLDSLGLGRPEPWVAGVADPSRRLIALRVEGPQMHPGRLRAVFRHEAAHVALHAATAGNAARWLQEGYAQIVSGTWDWREGWRLQFILMRGGEGLLDDIDRRFRSGREPETAYILAYTAVDALRSIGGDAGLAGLFAALRAGQSFDGAVRDVYGLTAEQFETRWRERVLDRYGWLYLLSRTAFLWLAVTLLIIGLGIARVRRDRRRLAEMRERERREAAAVRAALRMLRDTPDGPEFPDDGEFDDSANVS